MAKYEVRLLIDTEEGNPDKWDWNALTGENVLDWHTIVVEPNAEFVSRPDRGEPIGARITYTYASVTPVTQLDLSAINEGYVSFGVYDEETECDQYGYGDDQIFYYSNPAELQELLGEKQVDGWTLLGYEYNYKEAQ